MFVSVYKVLLITNRHQQKNIADVAAVWAMKCLFALSLQCVIHLIVELYLIALWFFLNSTTFFTDHRFLSPEMWRRSFSKFAIRASGLGFLTRSFSRVAGKRFAALWGNGDYGRLGLGNLNSQWKPVVCTALRNENLKAIACGGAHTLFLTGSLFIPLYQIGFSSIFPFFFVYSIY